MAFIIKVTLDAAKQYLKLTHVTGNGYPQIDYGPYPVLIVWLLDSAKGDQFKPMNGNPPTGNDPPGFSWDPPSAAPSPDVFDTPTLRSNGRMLSMTDFHPSGGAAAEWHYVLSAMIGGKPYRTAPPPEDPSSRTPHDPIIINK